MRLRPLLIFAGFLAATVAGVGALSFWDRGNTTRLEQEHALQLARQIAAQTDGLLLTARTEHKVPDPLGWALRHMALGVEPKPARVNLWQATPPYPPSGEVWSLDRKSGTLVFYKILLSDKKLGIRVDVPIAFQGFLGQRSRALSDLAHGALLLLLLGAIYLPWRLRRGAVVEREIRKQIQKWVPDARSTLMDTGSRLKEFLKQTQTVIDSGHDSSLKLVEVLGQIQGDAENIRTALASIQSSAAATARAETLSLSLAVAARKFGPNAKTYADLTVELHRVIKAINKQHQKILGSLSTLETSVLPILESAAESVEANHQADELAQSLNDQVKTITEGLLREAKLIQELKARADKAA